MSGQQLVVFLHFGIFWPNPSREAQAHVSHTTGAGPVRVRSTREGYTTSQFCY